MNTSQHKHPVAHVSVSCAKPGIRQHLSIYITDPLDDPLAEEVEDHLLDCRHCREFFMTMLQLRDEARRQKEARGGGNGRPSNEAKVFSLADFKKGGP